MFVSDKVIGIFQIAKDTVDALREDLAVVRAERDLFKQELQKAQIQFDWIRVKVNGLEAENKALIQKAYNINLPVPEIIRAPKLDPTYDPHNFSFEDLGEDTARTLGMPVYDDR